MGASDKSPPIAADPAKVAAGLTEAQRKGLLRLCDNFVYVDQRSLPALMRRGLAVSFGRRNDALFGDITLAGPTSLGRKVGLAVRRELEGGDHAE